MVYVSDYKCNLIIPGFPKCGTSSFHEYLDVHPKICMSDPKECGFFARDSVWSRRAPFHNSLFDSESNALYFGESSTIYSISQNAIDRIKTNLKNPRIMILMRQPVARLISHYKWLYVSGIETRPFRQAIAGSGHEFDPEQPIKGCYRGYIEFSSYAKWVPKWQQELGTENVLLIQSEGLRRNPVSILDGCASFLELEIIQWILPHEVNRTDDIVLKTEKRMAPVIRRMVPQNVRENIPIKSVAKKVWNKMFVASKKIPPPDINQEDIDWANSLLVEHLEYYECVFRNGVVQREVL